MKTTLSLVVVLVGTLAAGCSSDGTTNTSTSSILGTGQYYNLTPGNCSEFSNDAGGFGPSLALKFKTATSPPGIEIDRVRHGITEERDFVSYDAGIVFLNEREIGSTQEAYATALNYLPTPPLVVNGPTLSSNTACSSNACITMDLQTTVVDSRPYTGPYADLDAGSTEYKVNFVLTANNDAGASETIIAWITPGIGFTDLFLQSDNQGPFTDYKLVNIVPDGGVCANN